MISVSTLDDPQTATSSLPELEWLRSRIHRLTVEQYHQMVEGGILDSGQPVELLNGILVKKMVKNPPHRIALNHLRDLLMDIEIPGWHLQIQDPITTDDSEPEPDLSIVRGTTDDYADRHPEPHDVGLVVEVAETSLHEDRAWKQAIYARNRIPEYWIIKLIERQIEVYTQPTGPCDNPLYANRRIYREDQNVPVLLAGNDVGQIEVANVLP